MANLVAVEATNLLKASLGIAAYTAFVTPSKLALITTTTPSTAAAAGSEVSGGSYARADISTSSIWGTASGGTVTNSAAAVNFTNMPAVTSVGGIEIWDSTATPVRKWFGTLTANKTTNAGDTLTFATSSITATLS